MSRGKQGFFTFVATLATVATMAVAPAWAADSDPVAGSDEKAPESPSALTALPATGGTGVELTWKLSPSDFVRQGPVGNDPTSGGTFVNVNDVAGYNIYRDGVLVDTAPAGDSTYVDELAAGSSIRYNLTAVDAAGNESDPPLEAFASLGPPPTAVIPGADVVFGAVGRDEAPTMAIEVSNIATDAAALMTATASMLAGGQGFTVAPPNVQVSPNGGTGTFTVTFDAAAVGNLNGDYSDTVVVRTNDPNNAVNKIAVSASIIAGLVPANITVSRATVRFGQLIVTDPAKVANFVVRNTGELPLTVTMALAASSPAYGFSHLYSTNPGVVVSGLPSGGEIPGGEAVIVFITLAPNTGAGQYDNTLVITSNDLDQPEIRMPISSSVVAQVRNATKRVVQVIRVANRFTTVLHFSDPDIPSVDAGDPASVNAFLSNPVAVSKAKAILRAGVAGAAGIDLKRIINDYLSPGSLIYNYDIAPPPAGSSEPTAAEAAASIAAAAADSTSSLGMIGVATTESAAAEAEIYPRDADGLIVVGWFAVDSEDAVGLASFFLFAGQYATTSASANWNTDFDIAPAEFGDGKVDLADFFLFADYYGTEVENADAYRSGI